MALRLLVSAARRADVPGAEVVVLETPHALHAEVLAAGEPRSTHHGCAFFEASLREAPQDEDVGVVRTGSEASSALPFHHRPEGPGRYLRLDAGEPFGSIATADLDGIVLRGAAGLSDLERLGAHLAVVEAESGLADGALRVIAVADTPRGVLALLSCRRTPRLSGLACDPARLAAALGCARDAPAIVEARALTVLAAGACGVPAILVAPAYDAAVELEGFAALLLDGDR